MNSQQAILLYNLVRRARDADSGQQLQFLLLNNSYSLVPYHVAVLWSSSAGVIGVSNVASVDANAPMTLWLDKLLASTRDGFQAYRLSLADVSSETAESWHQNLPFFAAVVGFNHGAGRAVVLFARDEPWQDTELILLDEWVKTWASYWEHRDASIIRVGRIARVWYESLPSYATLVKAVTDTFAGGRYVIINTLETV